MRRVRRTLGVDKTSTQLLQDGMRVTQPVATAGVNLQVTWHPMHFSADLAAVPATATTTRRAWWQALPRFLSAWQLRAGTMHLYCSLAFLRELQARVAEFASTLP